MLRVLSRWVDHIASPVRRCARSADPSVRVGCDIASIREVRETYARFGSRYAQRVLQLDLNESDAVEFRAETLAGRFAALEAVSKVLDARHHGLVPADIAVSTSATGRPVVTLSGVAAQRAGELGIRSWDVSISHDGGFAIAVAVASCDSQYRHGHLLQLRKAIP
ncbi:Holo-[acyl-carrier-protein] synthase [Corynebacterium capitovis DSM 44611]|nr:Holo-[acyl-carrier-protein] synthase [Corynebacterium capitovis DSM 44611]